MKQLFGLTPKIDIATSSLPGEQIAHTETEEHLEGFLNTSEGNLVSNDVNHHVAQESDRQPSSSSSSVLTEQQELIFTETAGAKENILVDATNLLRTSKKNIVVLKLAILYEFKFLTSTVAVQTLEMW